MEQILTSLVTQSLPYSTFSEQIFWEETYSANCAQVRTSLSSMGILTLLLGSVLGRISWINVLFLAAPLAGLIGWLAVGHEIETRVRRGEKLPTQLLFSGAAIIISYTTIYNAVFGFFGLGDPTAVN